MIEAIIRQSFFLLPEVRTEEQTDGLTEGARAVRLLFVLHNLHTHTNTHVHTPLLSVHVLFMPHVHSDASVVCYCCFYYCCCSCWYVYVPT